MSRPLAVLGLNLGHDRSACLLIDGVVRVAIAEERLSRKKHDMPINPNGDMYAMFPHLSVAYCLDACGLHLADVDVVRASTTYVKNVETSERRQLSVEDIVGQCAELVSADVAVTMHHLAHAASAALCSPFAESAVLVVDGGGSIKRFEGDRAVAFERTSIFRHEGHRLDLIESAVGGPPLYGNSIGDFYQLITMYLGFGSGEEGKTMGLSAYGYETPGKPPLVEFESVFEVDDGVLHHVDERFQFTAGNGYPQFLVDSFGPPRSCAQPDNELDRKIAASAQWALEGAILGLADATYRRVPSRSLTYAGGVALNCVANGRIVRESRFNRVLKNPS